jgi:hypothetical protein
MTYFRSAEALKFDELEKLISLLPPPEAEKDTSAAPQSLTTARLPFLANGASYLLKLPPEYQHTRPYPMLVVLPNGGEKLSEALERLGDWPSRHGFIVAVIDWAAAFHPAFAADVASRFRPSVPSGQRRRRQLRPRYGRHAT